jgi:multiple inositol-polyphosphate phosphatase / 2,3-bisphosphoglycerate 3-phosphatase
MKHLLLFFLFIATFSVAASAQNCGTNYLGTKTLYKAPVTKSTAPPAGYRPVFIDHLGRHGARHLTKDVKTTSAYALLTSADSAGALTSNGKKLLQMVIALQKIEKGSTKSISAEGKDELKGLGERMYLNYPNVFKSGVRLKAAVTKEIRTKQSADAFLAGLNSKLSDTVKIEFYNDDTSLRFYDLSPTYKAFEDAVDDSPIKLALDKSFHRDEIDEAVTARIFSPEFLKKLSSDVKEGFVDDVFGFATIVYSLKTETQKAGYTDAQVDFKSFFTCDELERLGEMDSADENLKKGPGTDNNGIQVRIAAPLLADFINAADDFVKNGIYNARLRFAHAETVAPFAALLQISTADKASKNAAQLSGNWHAAKVIPLSANVMWVFYKKPHTPGYLVKILLNEKEVRIDGLKTNTYPYYNWSLLRTFYTSKLAKLK